MITDSIQSGLKSTHVKGGDANVFGMDSPQRRSFNQEECEQRFTKVWADKLEPELRRATPITLEAARELLDPKLHSNLRSGYEYRQFVSENAHFLARLSRDGSLCDQLWSIGAHVDPARLSVLFRSVDAKRRFDEVAKQLGWEPKWLAEKLLCNFIETVQRCPVSVEDAEPDGVLSRGDF